MKLIFAALAFGLPGAAPALPPILAVAPANDAARLVALIVPEHAMLTLVMASARSEAQTNRQFAGDPAMVDFVLKRMRPEIEKIVREGLPELRADMVRIISAEMTPAEIADVYTFFASPTGQRLQQTTYDVIAENPAADASEHQRIAIERFTESITPADLPALTAFGTSAGAAKMRGVTPKTTAASEAWAERLLSRHGTRMDTLRTQAIADYRKQKGQ